MNIHALLADGLLINPAMAGRLRRLPVGITHSNYTPPSDEFEIEENFNILTWKAAAIADPFEQSFFLLVHIPYLQAFDDINKRTSRISANVPLLKADLAPMSFVTMNDRDYIDGLIGIYELNTDQVAAVDFRDGNTPPNKDNLAFIQRCKEALPAGVRMKALRIDAAGYQEAIIRYCDAHDIRYAIRATMSGALKALAMEAAEGAWQPLLDQKGKPADQESFRSVHCIGDYEQVFTVVLQRQAKRGQKELDLEDDTEQAPVDDGFETVNYVYHAIGSRGATTEPRLDRQGRPPPGGPMAQNKVDSTPPR